MPQPLMRPAGEASKPITRRFAFARERLAGVRKPATGRAYVYDTKTPHLAYMITDTGATSWLWYGRVRGEARPIRFKIGGGDELTLEQARDQASAVTAGALQGISPAETKRRAAGVKTFGDTFTWYINEHAKPRKRTWQEDQNQHDRHLKPFDGRKLDAIAGEDVRKLHSKIGATAPIAANRVLALLSTVYNKSKAAGMYVGENPAAGVDKFPETQRDRFLQADELPKFIAALKGEPSDVMRDFFELCLWTGARRSNVQAMRWDEINVDRRTWTIPPAKAKAGQAIVLPLSDPAAKVLARRKVGRSAWVFPSASKSGHLQEPKTAWKALLKRAGLKALKIHDLRRTFGSWQAVTGASLPVIGKSLGHRNQATTAIYARLSMDPVRASVETATAAMQAAIRAKPAPKKKAKGRK